MTGLNVKALLGCASLAVAMGLLLFIPAGTVRYWQAWVFLIAFFVPAALIGVYLARHDPALQSRRLRGGPTAEKETAQKIIMLFVSIEFVGLLVVPALDHRFGWSRMPLFLVIAGDLLVVAGFYITFLAYKENTFSAATVEVERDQRVITTGPYAHLRHPQYAGALLYLFGMPLALGSFWGLLVFAALVPMLIWRLIDEERLLACELPGYRQYQERVRWRLLPGIF